MWILLTLLLIGAVVAATREKPIIRHDDGEIETRFSNYLKQKENNENNRPETKV